MGLFDKLKIKDKEQGKAWYINKQRGYIELEDSFLKIQIKFPKSENIVFYKDITTIERVGNSLIVLKTNTKEYKLGPVGFGDIKKTLADETYIKLLEKISKYK
jgi:hypothetical protein